MSTNSSASRSMAGKREALDEHSPRACRVDPRDQLSTSSAPSSGARPAGHGVAATGDLLAVTSEHLAGDAEQPGPRGTPARVEGRETGDRADKGLRGQIGHRLRSALRRAKNAVTTPTCSR